MIRKINSFVLILFLITVVFALPASANSAQTHWRGVDSTGAFVTDQNCPIEVEKEILTFELSQFPLYYYSDPKDYLDYPGQVTAEYTFYNPADYTVTATLVFPFGRQPAYGYFGNGDGYTADMDTVKYDIAVNGEPISKRVRYTLKTDASFALFEDLSKLSDTYVNDSFYSPTMTVTKYTYRISGIDTSAYRAANVAFDWNGGDGSTRLYFPEQSGFHTQKDGDGRFSMWVENGEEFAIYAIGKPLGSPLTWHCYEDGGVKDGEQIDGTVTLIKTESTTLEEFALAHWRDDTGVSEVDWYNAVIGAMNGSRENSKYHYIFMDQGLMQSTEQFVGSLMRWYEYEITLAPEERIVNTVTAPIYPSVDFGYEPDIYEYTYLLSPASTWADFGNLEIYIHTPFYMTEQSMDGFVKTEDGYVLKQRGLPDGELVFTLCASENPQKEGLKLDYWLWMFSGLGFVTITGFAAVCGVILAVVVSVIFVVVIFIRKKRQSKIK